MILRFKDPKISLQQVDKLIKLISQYFMFVVNLCKHAFGITEVLSIHSKLSLSSTLQS
jgi:hypothetical protein